MYSFCFIILFFTLNSYFYSNLLIKLFIINIKSASMENRDFERKTNPVYYYQRLEVISSSVFKNNIFFFKISKLLNSDTILKEML